MLHIVTGRYKRGHNALDADEEVQPEQCTITVIYMRYPQPQPSRLLLSARTGYGAVRATYSASQKQPITIS